MSERRRWIDEAAPDSLRQKLLEAGRSAAPSEAAKQELLRALATKGVGAAAGAALGSKALLASIPMASIGKCVLLVGIAGAGAFLYYGKQPDPVTVSAAVGVPSDPRPAVPDAVVSVGVPSVAPPVHDAPPRARVSPKSRSPRVRRSAEAEAIGSRLAQTPADALAADPAPVDAPSVASSPPRPSAAPIETSLGRELAALEAARRALRAADVVLARRFLSEYFARFPEGYLAPEARALDQQLKAQNTPPP